MAAETRQASFARHDRPKAYPTLAPRSSKFSGKGASATMGDPRLARANRSCGDRSGESPGIAPGGFAEKDQRIGVAAMRDPNEIAALDLAGAQEVRHRLDQ